MSRSSPRRSTSLAASAALGMNRRLTVGSRAVHSCRAITSRTVGRAALPAQPASKSDRRKDNDEFSKRTAAVPNAKRNRFRCKDQSANGGFPSQRFGSNRRSNPPLTRMLASLSKFAGSRGRNRQHAVGDVARRQAWKSVGSRLRQPQHDKDHSPAMDSGPRRFAKSAFADGSPGWQPIPSRASSGYDGLLRMKAILR
jgi:hypothetical protein